LKDAVIRVGGTTIASSAVLSLGVFRVSDAARTAAWKARKMIDSPAAGNRAAANAEARSE